MKQLNRTNIDIPTHPIRVMQFGGGNFLRAFVGYMIDTYNKQADQDLGIAVVKVTPRGDYSQWKAQDGLYHVQTKGIQAGELVNKTDLISSVSTIIHAYDEWETYIATAKNPDIKFIVLRSSKSTFSSVGNDK
ncbi:MAG: tagaturonate reductase, partial [Bacteroidota bacterium]